VNEGGGVFAGRFRSEFRDDAESTVATVLAGSLAEVDVRGERVGQVVANLVSLSNCVAESRENIALLRTGPRGRRASGHGETHERRGLFHAALATTSTYVCCLSADHAIDANFLDSFGQEARIKREDPISFVEKSEGRQDRQFLSIPDVNGGAAAAEAGVVHSRQVIERERRGVKELDRARDGESSMGRGATNFGSEQSKHRAHVFSAEEGILDGLVQTIGTVQPRNGQQGTERLINYRAVLLDVVADCG
jgi:hypothetical protein